MAASQSLSTSIADGGVGGIVVAFTDTDGTAVTPSSATWSLYNPSQQIVNGREDEVISPLSTSVTIVLSGNDVLYSDGANRRLVVTYTYDSSTLGNGVTDNKEITFNIVNIVGI